MSGQLQSLPLDLRGYRLRYPMNRRLGRSHSGSGLGRKEKSFVLTANRPRLLGCAACSLIIIRKLGFQKIGEGVTRKFILIRSNKMQQYTGIYLLQKYSTCFGCLSHPSSGVHQIVTAASGTGHSIRATTFCQRGL